ncbi:MAG: hypothetical protein AAFO04_05415, partial [Cyanobacteria bacterium J06592_8]
MVFLPWRLTPTEIPKAIYSSHHTHRHPERHHTRPVVNSHQHSTSYLQNLGVNKMYNNQQQRPLINKLRATGVIIAFALIGGVGL